MAEEGGDEVAFPAFEALVGAGFFLVALIEQLVHMYVDKSKSEDTANTVHPTPRGPSDTQHPDTPRDTHEHEHHEDGWVQQQKNTDNG